ncbi:MAG: carbohydrate ABC transporter permease [Gemmatimonadetes bacterium]|jgi:ABC-type glycerol-3-phosphate transport system permease component|nr:carbohydrate ABC transporter permease [Gemmatimonadota bacterium]MDE0962556.1 carbohydrate ABC transporter permease [Candidatus Latescibacterota bacterium]MBT5450393.1 carbohydrate ABC transporter permease [Gemmatimonadota bacterium]MBT6905608.1 carbohydrate ABC transporter permease [Gemmatimonadota bacterium]MBT7422166.1 carbohydrate ABC transporter permease [Gemmatimonadota bacterium]
MAIKGGKTWLVYGGLGLGGLAAGFPFAWMLLASFMTRGESLRRVFLPESLQWGNYLKAWQEADFGLYFENSLIIAVIQVSGTLLFSLLAAYPLARMEFRGRDTVFAGVLATLMIPETVTIVPNFLTITWLHRNMPFAWLNNWPAMTIPFMASAFSIFLLRQFMRGIPNELWDSARIDGAGHVRFLFQILLPLCRAPLLTVGMFTYIGSWNALAWPLLVTNTPDWRPISVGLQQFVSEAGAEVHLQMAGAVIATVPVLLAYFLIQREFTEGISMSGLKG